MCLRTSGVYYAGSTIDYRQPTAYTDYRQPTAYTLDESITVTRSAYLIQECTWRFPPSTADDQLLAPFDKLIYGVFTLFWR